MMLSHSRSCAAIAACLSLACQLRPAAGADVEVVKPGASKLLIDTSGVAASGESGLLFKRTLDSDLELSGWFKLAQGRASFRVWGSCSESGGQISAACAVAGGSPGGTLLSRSERRQAAEARRLAHEFADAIVFAVKGVKGIASARIAMVGTTGGKKDIYICDSDGQGLVRITKDNAICLAPSWGHDGQSLVYTSFVGGFPDVYMIDLREMARRKLAGFPGLNSGGAVSPDGRSAALTLSKDGNVDIYVMNLASRSLSRVTRSRRGAEASPAWSPDGRRLAFASDQTGARHIYVAGADGARERRITFRGNENVAPDWGADGRIAYASRRGGRFRICVLDPDKGGDGEEVAADGADYEDPSWGPDGRHIVCARTAGYHSDVFILDTMGDAPVRVTRMSGDWYSPAWSPK